MQRCTRSQDVEKCAAESATDSDTFARLSMPRQFQMSLPFQRVQGKRFVRIRAHVNPLSFSDQYGDR